MHSGNATCPAAALRYPENVTSLWKSKRLYIVVFLFTLTIINFTGRVNMFVAAPYVAGHFGWDNATMGVVMSSFLWTYVICLTPMGGLVDRFGARTTKIWASTLWATAAILTGFTGGLFSMIAVRLAFGAGSSATWPSCGKVVSTWFPVKERATATSFYQAGAGCGSAIAMPAVAWLVVAVDWRMSFVVTGAIGFAWLALWWKMYREPEACAWLPEDERAYILAERAVAGQAQAARTPRPGKSKLLRVLGQKTMWGLALSHGAMAYTQLLILAWLPSYLMQVKQMDIKNASYFSAGALLFATVLALVAARMNDAGMNPERVAQGSRKNTVLLFMLLSTIIGCVTLVDSLFLIFLFVGLAFGFTTTALSLNLALTTDLIKDSGVTGTAISFQVLGGSFFSLVAPVVTGFIAQFTGSFDSSFYLAGVLLCCGAFIAHVLIRKPIE
ncbi:MAG: MFS transporter [Deltaproteobacteria bacterium]|jgi:ACS family glucarate transporter-like MFS transporter|nr:MFS transporter [Deltaproteobacteria bacterium]